MHSPSFWHSLGYAFEGIVHTVRTQRNARIHLSILTLVLLVGLGMHISRWEWTAIALTSGMVLSLETLNSAVENLVDHVQPDYHHQAKIVKDAAAGAVLLAAMTSVIVGVLIFGPRLWAMVKYIL